MDQQVNGQDQVNKVDGNPASYGTNTYEAKQPDASADRESVLPWQCSSQSTGAQLSPHELAYDQHIQQQQQLQLLRQQLQTLWANQYQEIEKTTDFRNHSLPLARIKKIMKADEDVRMISAEAPIVFARACEMFILELTLRSWNHTEENKRRTLQKNDIAAAIMRTDIFDFLVDIVPREEVRDEVVASLPRGSFPVGMPSDSIAYCYMPTQESLQRGPPGGMMTNKPAMDPILYTQQAYPYLTPQMWPQASQQSKTDSDS